MIPILGSTLPTPRSRRVPVPASALQHPIIAKMVRFLRVSCSVLFFFLIVSRKPQRSQPKIVQVLVKTHKLTVFLALPNETAISAVKEQVLSAFLDDVFGGIDDVPKISSLDDFVLSREVIKRGIDTTSYEVLTDDQLLKNVVGNWAVLFVQFKDDSGARDVTVSSQFTGPSFIYLQAEYTRLKSLSLH